METIDLAVYTGDSDYDLALGQGLSTYKNNFIVKVCGNESEISRVPDFDLLITGSGGSGTAEKLNGDRRVIRLTDSYSDVVKDIESMNFVLYKYDGIEKLSADILLYYSMLTGKRNFSWANIKSKIIVFCGCTGGVGKTTVTFGAAQALCRYYSKSVLYISLEEIESTLRYIEGHGDGFGLCEYLYYLFKQGGKKPDAGAFMIRDKYGVSAFKPDKGRNRLRELDSEKMAGFLKEISESGSFDYILLDTGECFSEEIKWIFKICDKIAVILSPDGAGDEREQRFLTYLNFITGSMFSDKHVTARNKVVAGEETETDDGIICLDFDDDSIRDFDGIIEVSIDQDFGTGIKKLTKEIL